jgi:hypothetical protein
MCGHHDARASGVPGWTRPRQHIFGRNIPQQGDHARAARVVLGQRGHRRGQRGGEDRVAQPAAQALHLVDRGPQRRLAHHLDQGLGRRVVDTALVALWAAVT